MVFDVQKNGKKKKKKKKQFPFSIAKKVFFFFILQISLSMSFCWMRRGMKRDREDMARRVGFFNLCNFFFLEEGMV